MGLCLLAGNIAEKYSLSINDGWMLEGYRETYVPAVRDCNVSFGSKAFVP